MPTIYKHKTDRANKTPANVMQRAADTVAAGGKWRTTAKDFGIDRMTLKRFIDKKVKEPNVPTGYDAVLLSHSVFTHMMEADLANHVKILDMFHGLTIVKCRELEYEFARHNNFSNS